MDILKYSKFLIGMSLFIIISGFYIILTYGFKASIEYTGGSVFTFKYSNDYKKEDLEKVLRDQNISSYEIFKDKNFIDLKISDSESGKVLEIQNKILSQVKSLELESSETIGPAMGVEFAKNSFLAVIFSLISIVIFITYSFYNLPNQLSSWKFGVAAIVAMFHDVLVVLSSFSLGGYFFNIEIDALFLTALLTIIGFSINDTIVVFDRIRENLLKYGQTYNFTEICNMSIFETLNRSLITSFTVILIMSSLYLLGGESIKYFSLSLVIGITAGTYSSIFIATPFVLFLTKISKK